MNQNTLLKVKKLSKSYEGVWAIRDIEFDLFRGEIHALIGENGAGKSTLCKIIAGSISQTSGDIFADGKQCVFKSTSDALKQGISMVYQETSLVNPMTVAQNIHLGDRKFYKSRRSVLIDAQQLLQSLGFNVDPSVAVESLSAAHKQMVEIAKAIKHKSDAIIFDEPTASLTPEEKMHFFGLMTKLRQDNKGIIFISHALEEALEYADRITVLRDGNLVQTWNVCDVSKNELIKQMVGRDISKTHYSKNNRPHYMADSSAARKVLSVENITQGNIVKNMTFSLYSGQITAMAGLVGCGRTAAAKIICGAQKRNLIHGGEIFLDGKTKVAYRVPRQAIRDGIAYVTEDRKREGFFETMGINENIYLGWLAGLRRSKVFLKGGERKKIAEEWGKRIGIKSINLDAKAVELSGGNQQKLVICKSLVANPDIIIFDEPTRGVDVGAIEDIHKLLRELADKGKAVLVISSYLPEVMSLGDRILVVKQGRVVEEFNREDATEEKIMFAAVH